MSSPPLHTCPCGGFVPAAAPTCPHCDRATARPRRFARVLATMAGAGAFAMTLMACYGVMPREGYPRQPDCTDADADGACVPQDCNDADAVIYPGAADVDGDAIDSNCDGVDGWRDPATVAAPAQDARPAPTTTPTPPPAPPHPPPLPPAHDVF
jgi:hypothetical protein